MKVSHLARLRRPAAQIAVLMTTVAAGTLAAQTVPDAQVPSTGLNLPQNLQIFGKADPNVRKPTAIVNGAVLTGTDVDQRMAMTIGLSEIQNGRKVNLPADQVDQVKLQMLRELVDDTLKVQEAKANDITIPQAQIETSYARVARNFNKSPDELTKLLRGMGSSDRALKRQLEGDLAWNRLLSKKVTPQVNVSEDEAKAILARLEASKGTEEYHLSEIFLRVDASRPAEEVVEASRKMIEQMRGGSPFEYFARNFSDASTKAVGGDLDWVRLDVLPKELQTAATGLQVGQIAGPIEVPGGYSILYLVDKRQVLTVDPRDAKLSLRQLTVKFPAGISEAQANQRGSVVASAVKRINGCGSVAKIADEIGAEVVDNDSISARELPPALQEVILKMQIGQSTPIFGDPKEGVRAFVLCGRDDPKAANLPTTEQIQARLEDQRVNLRAQRMLRDLRRDAVVEYR
ncbi:peptidylprolyl isomerase [Sphingomonas sp. Leaf33]|uniref:peptidylprolyl isomerase n=1 Tax=Sphingomonas sp. Leaf33 TaxID=1736215 RepID=UPI0006FE53B3|nr:peptidylprolyl isomerase [Sphingomonas sp. Leaf33]KQN26940.1 peptidylprolyl isomerase [Sphingomonas sp. Leaf33]